MSFFNTPTTTPPHQSPNPLSLGLLRDGLPASLAVVDPLSRQASREMPLTPPGSVASDPGSSDRSSPRDAPQPPSSAPAANAESGAMHPKKKWLRKENQGNHSGPESEDVDAVPGQGGGGRPGMANELKDHGHVGEQYQAIHVDHREHLVLRTDVTLKEEEPDIKEEEEDEKQLTIAEEGDPFNSYEGNYENPRGSYSPPVGYHPSSLAEARSALSVEHYDEFKNTDVKAYSTYKSPYYTIGDGRSKPVQFEQYPSHKRSKPRSYQDTIIKVIEPRNNMFLVEDQVHNVPPPPPPPPAPAPPPLVRNGPPEQHRQNSVMLPPPNPNLSSLGPRRLPSYSGQGMISTHPQQHERIPGLAYARHPHPPHPPPGWAAAAQEARLLESRQQQLHLAQRVAAAAGVAAQPPQPPGHAPYIGNRIGRPRSRPPSQQASPPVPGPSHHDPAALSPSSGAVVSSSRSQQQHQPQPITVLPRAPESRASHELTHHSEDFSKKNGRIYMKEVDDDDGINSDSNDEDMLEIPKSSRTDLKNLIPAGCPLSVEQIIEDNIDTLNDNIAKYSISEEDIPMIREVRRKGKNRNAARRSRQRRITSLEDTRSLEKDWQKRYKIEQGRLEKCKAIAKRHGLDFKLLLSRARQRRHYR